MRITVFSDPRLSVAILILTLCITPASAVAQQEQVLFSFNPSDDGGAGPSGSLISDAAGNLYGATSDDGTYGGGTVYMLSPTGTGWVETTLHEFGNGTDGIEPIDSLTLDSSGNLYGITFYGGTGKEGTVFELSPNAGGEWKETILKNFINDSTTGWAPDGNLIIDAAGNLYGVTRFGGDLSCSAGSGCGVVYELTPQGNGNWTESVLYEAPASARYFVGGLVFDASGDLYGADQSEIFELKPVGNGAWTKTAIYTFPGPPGTYSPNGNLVFDGAGNLYGTTFDGGTGNGVACSGGGCGTVFELSPSTGGEWTETVLHNFSENSLSLSSRDGYLTHAGVILGPNGVLYGTSPRGGNQPGCGTAFPPECGIIYALVPKLGGVWSYEILLNFSPDNGNGFSPSTALSLGPNGILYGTTDLGGTYGGGTVFKIEP